MNRLFGIFILSMVFLCSVTAAPKGQDTYSSIYKGYSVAMKAYFEVLVSLSTKHKDARGFFAALYGVSKKSVFLKSVPSDEATPKMVIVGDHIEIDSKEGKITMSLSGDLGELKIDGLTKPTDSKKKNAFLKLKTIFDLIVPTANAGLYDWMIGKGFMRFINGLEGNFGNFGTKGPHFRSRYNETAPFTARLAETSKGLAYTAGQAAILGCITVAHFSTPQETVAGNCGEGALGGAGIVAGMVGAGFAAAGVGAGLIMALEALPAAARTVLYATTRYSMYAGGTALLAHGVDGIVKADGAKLTCSYEGNFKMDDLSLTAKGKRLYSVSSSSIEMRGIIFKRTTEGVKSYLKTRDEYKATDDKTLDAMAQNVLTEVDALSKTCIKHGEGYTDKFRVEFDKEAIQIAKPTKEEEGPQKSK